MNEVAFKFAGFASSCLMVAVGCSSNVAASATDGGHCPTVISAPQGTNNGYGSMNGDLTGDYSGPDGSADFSTLCLRLGDVPQALQIHVLGAKPAVGKTYSVVTDNMPGNVAVVQYAEGNNGTKVWIGTSGTLKIDSVARDSIGLSFAQVIAAPDATKSSNTASGTLTISGSQRADDVLGFVP